MIGSCSGDVYNCTSSRQVLLFIEVGVLNSCKTVVWLEGGVAGGGLTSAKARSGLRLTLAWMGLIAAWAEANTAEC